MFRCSVFLFVLFFHIPRPLFRPNAKGDNASSTRSGICATSRCTRSRTVNWSAWPISPSPSVIAWSSPCPGTRTRPCVAPWVFNATTMQRMPSCSGKSPRDWPVPSWTSEDKRSVTVCHPAPQSPMTRRHPRRTLIGKTSSGPTIIPSTSSQGELFCSLSVGGDIFIYSGQCCWVFYR